MSTLLVALRAAAEITRLRILSVLRNSELTVSEIVHILDQSQPRVSRHLKLLVDSGLLTRYQEGAWVFHRIADSGESAAIAQGVLQLIDMDDAQMVQDQKRLQQIKQRNSEQATTYFSQNAAEWDSLRKIAVDDTEIESRLIAQLPKIPPKLMLDLGTGTGRILEILSPFIEKGVGIDLNREMLQVARSNLDSAGAANCTVRQGDISQLPFADHDVDLIVIHQVLHYMDDPNEALAESSRVLKPDGVILVVDFLPHELEFLREKHAHRRLGFSNDVMAQWANRHNLKVVSHEKLAPNNQTSRDLLSVGLWNLSKIGSL